MNKNLIPTQSILLHKRKGYTAIFNSKWLIPLLLFVFTAGCKKVVEEDGTTGVCPIVISTSPVSGATAVDLNAMVSATFNEPMNASTINAASFTLTQGATPIAGVISYTGVTATFVPTMNLIRNTVYTATMKAGVQDPAGNAMVDDYVWSFTTGPGPDVTRPTVTSTDPANAAIGVAFNKMLSAAFSEVMDPASINAATFTLANTTLGGTPVTGTVTYSGTTAVFSPTANLLPSTTYTATITTGAKDPAGNTLASNYTWSFTTGVAPDITRPTVIFTVPANGATGVAFNSTVNATFSEVMDPATINATTFRVMQGATVIAGTVTYTGLTATFTPTSNFTGSTTYTATITTGVRDLAGNTMASNYVWSFTTGIPPDVTPPTVIATDPLNNATAVALNKQISAVFSEAMDPATITTITFTLRMGATPVSGTVMYAGAVATFSPSASLIASTVYTATITTGARDLAGNALVSNYVWTFTTVAPVSVAPTLGSAALFGAFGGSAGITNQGINTVINNGGIGTTGASTLITGFHDGLTAAVYTETPLNIGLVTGGIFTAPPAPGTAVSFAIATQGHADAIIAYNSISPASRPGGTDPGAGELGGLTLPPGVYMSAGGSFSITGGNLTLNAMGDPNAVWIFQAPTSLTVGVAGPAGNRSVLLINGAQARNVFWYVGSAATINGAGGGVMTGNILASAGVTFSTAGNTVQTVLNGRALSLTASVTMVNTTINVP